MSSDFQLISILSNNSFNEFSNEFISCFLCSISLCFLNSSNFFLFSSIFFCFISSSSILLANSLSSSFFSNKFCPSSEFSVFFRLRSSNSIASSFFWVEEFFNLFSTSFCSSFFSFFTCSWSILRLFMISFSLLFWFSFLSLDIFSSCSDFFFSIFEFSGFSSFISSFSLFIFSF